MDQILESLIQRVSKLEDTQFNLATAQARYDEERRHIDGRLARIEHLLQDNQKTLTRRLEELEKAANARNVRVSFMKRALYVLSITTGILSVLHFRAFLKAWLS